MSRLFIKSKSVPKSHHHPHRKHKKLCRSVRQRKNDTERPLACTAPSEWRKLDTEFPNEQQPLGNLVTLPGHSQGIHAFSWSFGILQFDTLKTEHRFGLDRVLNFFDGSVQLRYLSCCCFKADKNSLCVILTENGSTLIQEETPLKSVELTSK